jgi:hypothetical protein
VGGYAVGRAFAREEHITLQLENIVLRGSLDAARQRARTLAKTPQPPQPPKEP